MAKIVPVAATDHHSDPDQAIRQLCGIFRAASINPGFCPFVIQLQKTQWHRHEQSGQQGVAMSKAATPAIIDAGDDGTAKAVPDDGWCCSRCGTPVDDYNLAGWSGSWLKPDPCLCERCFRHMEKTKLCMGEVKP